MADQTTVADLQQAIKDLNRDLQVTRNNFKSNVRDATRTQFADLESKIGETSRKLDATSKDLADTKKKADKDLKAATRKTDEEIEAIRDRLKGVERDLAALSAVAKSTQREFELLNRKVRQINEPGSKADIDTWATGQAALATEVREGREAARKLRALTDANALRARIEQHKNNVAMHRDYQDQAVNAARRLVALDPAASADEWAEPMRAWTTNQEAAASLAARLDSSAADSRQASAELEALSQHSSELLPAAERGERAEERLRGRIHGFMEAVVAGDKFLPSWMMLALGSGVPQENWRAWMDTAVSLVFYRIVYGVPSLVDALGERPAQAGERQDEYDRLRADCELYKL